MNLSTLEEVMQKKNGCYWDKDRPDNLQRYTIYVYVRGEEDCAEEIDVDAGSKFHALEIARAAWARDYQGPVKKMVCSEPRIGLYI